MSSDIPRRIIQIWGGGKDASLACKAAAMNVKLLHPGYEYIFYDDELINELMTRHFPQYKKVVDSFSRAIQRYDFIRYLAVYKSGGFYFDMDVLLASDISELLQCGCIFPFERLTWSDFLRDHHGRDWEIGNYAFGAAPGHPFLRAIIENCIRAQQDSAWREAPTRSLPRVLRDELAVIYSTGPGLVSRTLAEYDNPDAPVTVLFPDDVCDKDNCWNLFGRYGVHLGGGSWRTRHGAWRQRLINAAGRRNEARAIRLARKLGKTRQWEPQKT